MLSCITQSFNYFFSVAGKFHPPWGVWGLEGGEISLLHTEESELFDSENDF